MISSPITNELEPVGIKTACPNRKGRPRMDLEVCKFRVHGGYRMDYDPICRKRTNGRMCPVAEKIMEGRNGNA